MVLKENMQAEKIRRTDEIDDEPIARVDDSKIWRLAINNVLNVEFRQNAMPDGWMAMPEEYELSAEEKESGLKEILDESKKIAAYALGDFFASLGIESKYYNHIYKMPIGLYDDENGGDAYYEPGVYGILLHRYSDNVLDCEDLIESGINEDSLLAQRRTKNRLATDIAHEMVHSVLTVSNYMYGGDIFVTVGSFSGDGIEEGIAEAVAHVALDMRLSSKNYTEAVLRLESFCAKIDNPVTQMAARMMKNEDLLKWYLTCAQDGKYFGKNDMLKNLLGDEDKRFRRNMNRLLKYENGELNNPLEERAILDETEKIINSRLLKPGYVEEIA